MQPSHRVGAALISGILLAGCSAVAPGAPTADPSAATATAGHTPRPTVAATPSQTTVTASLPPARTVAMTKIALPGQAPLDAHIVAGPDAIWVEGLSRIYRIDPSTNQATAGIPVPVAEFHFAVAGGSAWIADFDHSRVFRIDLGTGDEIAVIPVGTNPESIVSAFDSIWTADHRGATVSRIDPRTNGVTKIEKVGFIGPSGPQGIAAGSDRIWVGVGNARTVFGIDPGSNSIVAAFPVGRGALPCGGILADVAAIWVSSCFERNAIAIFDPDDGSSTIVGIPGFAGQPVRVGELVWVPVVGSVVIDPILLAFGAEDLIAVDAIALPNGSEPDSAVIAFGSLWLAGPAGSVLRLSLTDLSG
jgi:DNA-binding beta-propeller fold protein YncE